MRYRLTGMHAIARAMSLLLILPIGGKGAESPVAKRPTNIVFILADDLGYGDLGCYGQKIIATPNIDRLAKQGMRFTQCYAGSTVCAPSRCVLMTGLHTGHCRIRGNALFPLLPQDRTVAEVLREAGYVTALVGKWGLGNEGTTGEPKQQGFTESFGFLDQKHAHNYYPDHLFQNGERIPLPGNIVNKGVASKKEVYAPDLFLRESLNFLERHRAEPFFLYMASTFPHANNEAGQQTDDGMEIPDYGDYAQKDWPSPQKGHAAMISRLDRDVGLLLAKLDELGLADNTLVFFTSDNGPHQEGGADPNFFDSNGPLRGLKRDLYEGGIRVPLIVRGSQVVHPGSVCVEPVCFADFLPTAAELADVAVPSGLDGVSLLPALAGKPLPQDRVFYWEFHEGCSSQAVRKGEWKGVRRQWPASPLELYNLSSDVGEQTDLAAKHPEKIAELERELKAARSESADWPLLEKGAKKAAKKKAAEQAAKTVPND